MDFKHIYYPESKFGGFTDIDGTIVFYTRVNTLLRREMVLLDIGCGRGAHADDQITLRKNLRIFKGRCQKIIGIDVDNEARQNPFIDDFFIIENQGSWPLLDESVDLAVCDSVLEHIHAPDVFFQECRRVIKPGGYLCIRTPNKLSYIAVISRLVPNKYHASVLRRVQSRREEADIFPTYYKINSISQVRYYFGKYGFDHCVYGYEAEPSYLSFSRFAYWLGVLHQRFAPKILKPAIFGFGKKIGPF